MKMIVVLIVSILLLFSRLSVSCMAAEKERVCSDTGFIKIIRPQSTPDNNWKVTDIKLIRAITISGNFPFDRTDPLAANVVTSDDETHAATGTTGGGGGPVFTVP